MEDTTIIIDDLVNASSDNINATTEPLNSYEVVNGTSTTPPFTSPEFAPEFNFEALDTVRRVSAGLSTFGSLWIVLAVVFNKKKRQIPYQRILLGLSIYDLGPSLLMLLDQVFPKTGHNIYEPTVSPFCANKGYWTYMGSIAVPLYNAALAYYFVLVVKYSWPTTKIVAKFERYIHPTIFILAVSLSVLGLPFLLDLYNPAYLFCSPFNNSPDTYKFGRDVYFFIYSLMLIGSTFVVTVLMVILNKHVQSIISKGNRFSFERRASSFARRSNNTVLSNRHIGLATTFASSQKSGAGDDQTNSMGFSESLRTKQPSMNSTNMTAQLDSSSSYGRVRRFSLMSLRKGSSHNQQEQTRLQQQQERMKSIQNEMANKVRYIAMFYSLPLYITWIVPLIWFFILTITYAQEDPSFQPTDKTFYIMTTYTAVFTPLQGFINWLVYMMPYFYRKTELPKQNPDPQCCFCTWFNQSLSKTISMMLPKAFKNDSYIDKEKEQEEQQQQQQQQQQQRNRQNEHDLEAQTRPEKVDGSEKSPLESLDEVSFDENEMMHERINHKNTDDEEDSIELIGSDQETPIGDDDDDDDDDDVDPSETDHSSNAINMALMESLGFIAEDDSFWNFQDSSRKSFYDPSRKSFHASSGNFFQRNSSRNSMRSSSRKLVHRRNQKHNNDTMTTPMDLIVRTNSTEVQDLTPSISENDIGDEVVNNNSSSNSNNNNKDNKVKECQEQASILKYGAENSNQGILGDSKTAHDEVDHMLLIRSSDLQSLSLLNGNKMASISSSNTASSGNVEKVELEGHEYNV